MKKTDIKVWIQPETCEEQMREYGRLGEDRKTWWGREEQGTTIRDNRDNPF